jgi:hypothetical protein
VSPRDFDGEPNLRSERYFIAHAKLRCGSCGAATGVVAVALPAGHESSVLDWPDEPPAEHDEALCVQGDGTAEFVGQEDVGDESGEASWEKAAGAAFLFYLDALPASVLHRLAGISAGYRRVAGSMRYYANHCETCGAMFDDEELFCEPGGPFSPTAEADARAIALTEVDEPIRARAGGYAIAPQFFEFIATG